MIVQRMKPDGSARRLCFIGAACIALATRSVAESRDERARTEQHGATAALIATSPVSASLESTRTVNLALAADDVIPTGNDWIALPSIRASDGALQNFNVISMRY